MDLNCARSPGVRDWRAEAGKRFFVETNKAKQIWAKACEFLSSAVSMDVYNRWIGVIDVVGDELAGQLTLTVPNGFYQDWLEEHYLPLIRKAIEASGAENVVITFMVDGSRQPAEGTAAKAGGEKEKAAKGRMLRS